MQGRKHILRFHRKISRFLILVAGIGSVSIAMGAESTAPYHAAACLGPVERATGPLVMRGAAPFLGWRTNGIGAFVFRQDTKSWAPIPVQVDEVNARGDFVLEGGQPFTANTDDGFVDENDELVLMLDDLGDVFTAEQVTSELTKGAAFAQKLVACADGVVLGHALIVGYLSPGAATTFAPAVAFDPEAASVRTQHYFYQFSRENASTLGQVDLFDGKEYRPAILRGGFLMPMRTRWYLPNWVLTDADVRSEIESWRIGPVRSIVAVGAKFKGFLSLLDLHLFSELIFYPRSLRIPTVVEFVFSPRKHLQAGSGVAYALEFVDPAQWTITSNLPDLPQQPGLAKHRAKDVAPAFHATGRRDPHSVHIDVRVDDRALVEVPPPYLLQKEALADARMAQNWPWLRRIDGDLAVFVDISALDAGVYDFGLDLTLAYGAERVHRGQLMHINPMWSGLPLR